MFTTPHHGLTTKTLISSSMNTVGSFIWKHHVYRWRERRQNGHITSNLVIVFTVLPAKSDDDVMLCLQSYQELIIDRSLVY